MHVLPLPLDKSFDLLDNFLMHFFYSTNQIN